MGKYLAETRTNILLNQKIEVISFKAKHRLKSNKIIQLLVDDEIAFDELEVYFSTP